MPIHLINSGLRKVMRLINIKSLELRRFDDNNIPPYAITSHRWLGEEDEVDFQEMSRGQGKQKKGYTKIVNFCKATQRLVDESPRLRIKLEWLWIDTCCINKNNAVEIQKAINLMFEWYSRAAVCLTFLRDVPSLSEPPAVIHSAIHQSEWWTRGWCLQELLAPELLLFYNRDWEVIGRKAAYSPGVGFSTRAIGLFPPPLTGWISNWTGIPPDVLSDFRKASRLTIAEKQAWMRNRITTEEEDFAYCQLGICGVKLIHNYGEGKVSALRRLREAIEEKERQDAAERNDPDDNNNFTAASPVLVGSQFSTTTTLPERPPSSLSLRAITTRGPENLVNLQIHLKGRAGTLASASGPVLYIAMSKTETIADLKETIRQKLGVPWREWKDAGYVLTQSDLPAAIRDRVKLETLNTTSLTLRTFS